MSVIACSAALVVRSAGATVSNSTAGVIHLTFDDGPDQLFTPLLLDLLDEHGAQVTFFLLGRNLAERWGSEEIQDLLNRGHALGNHSTHHRKLTTRHPFEVAADLEEASLLLSELSGYRPTCWRAPYGDRNDMVDAIAFSFGMSHVGWTADPQEWRQPSVLSVVDYLTEKRHDGSIVLMHDRKWLTLHIVADFVPAFIGEGWRFAPIDSCWTSHQQKERMATRDFGEVPVGRVSSVRSGPAGFGVAIEGWAYDADAPNAGLGIRVLHADGSSPVVAQTSPDHSFSLVIETPPEGPICLWVVDSGRKHHPSLGCHLVETS
ncbi:MAG: polysaccharide deacetylase family protein [Acidimicrobiales bacterium]|nr:polysaccharide deacetylase family protein [Acidimicrobiales bacterium]